MSRALAVTVLVLGSSCQPAAAQPPKAGLGTPSIVAGKLGPATHVSVERSHACALLASGRVACWGLPDERLGTPYSTTPQLVANLEDGIEIAHRCARRKAGPVVCWYSGLTAAEVPGTMGAQRLASTGLGTACLVTASGTAGCVAEGQVGLTPVEGLADLRALGREYDGMWCAARTDGKVMCAGEIAGLGLPSKRGVAIVPAIAGAVDVVVFARDLGCAITKTGALACFGTQLGRPDSAWLPPRADQINTTQCLRDGGRVECFDDARRRWIPTPLAAAAIDLSCYNKTCCAVLTGGAIQCWGDYGDGRLGDGVDVERQPVAKVDGLPAIASVVAGGGVTFARTRNNELYAWGLVGAGPRGATRIATGVTALAVTGGIALVGHGRDAELLMPDDAGWRHVRLPRLAADIRSLAFDGGHRSFWSPRYCAAIANGTTQCMEGDEWHGYTPWQPIRGMHDVTQLSATQEACGVTKTHSIVCIDRIYSGSATTAAEVPAIKRARRSAAPYVELGDGNVVRVETGAGKPVAVPVPALRGISGISFGGYPWSATCGIKAGRVVCWADDRDYKDANGVLLREPSVTIDKALPAGAGNLVATSVSTGETHACAVDAAGAVWCWGSDRSGQLGRGRIVENAPPVRVIGIGP